MAVDHYRSSFVVTSTAGTQNFNTSFVANGMLESIVITKAGASFFNSSGNITVAGALSGHVYMNVTATGASGSIVSYFPRAVAQSTAGVALGYTSAATPPGIPVLMPVGEAFQLRTTSGVLAAGASGRFTVDFYVSH